MELTDCKVKKRDDSYVDFDKSKISNAIYKAALASHDNKEQLDRSIADTLANMVCTCIYDKINDPELDVSSCDINISIPVETIQDIVERVLIKNGYADTAKAYILYRNKRNEIRNTRDSISKTISDILMSDAKDNDVKRENGNIDGNTAMGTMLQIGSNVSKNFYLENMISKDIAKAHIDGYIHIHDLDFYALTPTCCQIDFEKLAKGGFNPGHGYVREPNSIGSYATLAAISIQSDQGDCHGGQSIPNFDYAMVPGIYKSFRKAWKHNIEKAIDFGLINDNDFTILMLPVNENVRQLLLTSKENLTKDIIDRLCSDDNVYNIISEYTNVLGEVIASLCPVKYVRLKDMFESDDMIESVLTDDKNYQYFSKEKTGDCLDEDIYKIINMTKKDVENECYQAMEGFVHNLNTLHARAGSQLPFSSVNLGTCTSNAGRMVIKNLLLAMEAGLGHHETCIFPIVIFKVKEGVNYNPEDKNYDLLQLSYRVTGKRLFPNYVYLDSPFNLQYYKEGHPETEVATINNPVAVYGNIC